MIKWFIMLGLIVFVLIVIWCTREWIMNMIQEKDLGALIRLDGQLGDESDVLIFEKKRQRKTMMILCLSIAWPLLSYRWLYLVFVLAAAIYIYKQPYLHLKRKQRRLIGQLKHEFPLWLRQLQVLLQNHTVLQAMQLSIDRAPTILRAEIDDLIRKIQIDPVSINPYLEFMNEFEIYEIQKAMKLLYRYHFVGAEESYQQFHRMIEATGKWLRQARNEKKSNQLALLQWIGMVPLFGVTMMFLVMMVIVILEMMKGGI